VVAVVIAVAGSRSSPARTRCGTPCSRCLGAGVDVGGLRPPTRGARSTGARRAARTAGRDRRRRTGPAGDAVEHLPRRVPRASGPLTTPPRVRLRAARALAVPFAVQQDVEPCSASMSRARARSRTSSRRSRSARSRARVHGREEAVVVPGREGTAIDDEAVLDLARGDRAGRATVLRSPICRPSSRPSRPRRPSAAATVARTITAAPVRLGLKGEGEGSGSSAAPSSPRSPLRAEGGSRERRPRSRGIEGKLHPVVKPFTKEAGRRDLPCLRRSHVSREAKNGDDARRQGRAAIDLRSWQRAWSAPRRAETWPLSRPG
jgi:hypothetical protein